MHGYSLINQNYVSPSSSYVERVIHDIQFFPPTYFIVTYQCATVLLVLFNVTFLLTIFESSICTHAPEAFCHGCDECLLYCVHLLNVISNHVRVTCV